MEFDVLIIGGGVSGMSAALLFGSAQHKSFMFNKKIGIIVHQKTSSLQTAIFNNAYGITPGKKGNELLEESKIHLEKLYPHIDQIENEKVLTISGESPLFSISTNKNIYRAKNIIIGIGAGNPFTIEGLDEYIIPHQKAAPEKNRLQLKNQDYLVKPGLYAVGTLAGLRSQLMIAAGSGAAVATDIMTLWNDNTPVQIHDALPKE